MYELESKILIITVYQCYYMRRVKKKNELLLLKSLQLILEPLPKYFQRLAIHC